MDQFGSTEQQELRGKVILVNFWTYSCINSLRELPYMKAWAAKFLIRVIRTKPLQALN